MIKLVKFNNLIYQELTLNIERTSQTCSPNTTSSNSDSQTPTQFGFVIAGYCPSRVDNVVANSMSHVCGLRKNDLIMKINDINCCRATLKTILALIKNSTSESSNGQLKMTIYRAYHGKAANNCLANTCSTTVSNGNNNTSGASRVQGKSKVMQSSKKMKLNKLLKASAWLKKCTYDLNKKKLADSTFYYQHSTASTTVNNYEHVSCKKSSSSSSSSSASSRNFSVGDTGYETLSRFDSNNTNSTKMNSINKMFKRQEQITDEATILTVTNTINSYSDCGELTMQTNKLDEECKQADKLNEYRTKLIGNLIEMEANFVSYLGIAVATLARPLRGFFIKQQDYFTLFQNIEKILIISENFLRSMDKWSAYDLYTKLGHLYAQKISLFKEAFTIYVKGYSKSKHLLGELKVHSKQFRLFLREAQSSNLTLKNLIDSPLKHMNQTLLIFKQVKMCTIDTNELYKIDQVIFDLNNILDSSAASLKLKKKFQQRAYANLSEIDELKSEQEANEDEHEVSDEQTEKEFTSSTSYFMNGTIQEETTRNSNYSTSSSTSTLKTTSSNASF